MTNNNTNTNTNTLITGERQAAMHVPKRKMTLFIKDYKALAAGELICKDILNVLAFSDGVRMIGLHGMGGVGKTTVVNRVATEGSRKGLFDKVVMVFVTWNVEIKIIQRQIAEQLGMELREESETVRAKRLCKRLKQEKKILIILDSLWEKLNLNEVGIPDEDELGVCKILLTCRDYYVLRSMDCEKIFTIGVLSETESWDLFQKRASNGKFEDEDIQSVASKIAQKCAGLPVAIVTIASALKNKSLPAWRNALRELRRPSHRNFEGICALAYYSLEISYKNLESEELQLTLLVCSLMGHKGNLEDLLRYGMALGLFPDVVEEGEARDRVQYMVDRLKASCLLLGSDTGPTFTMHDIVRDVARSIALRDHPTFVERFDDVVVKLKWSSDKDTLKDCQQISLYGENTITQKLKRLSITEEDEGEVECWKGKLDAKLFLKPFQGCTVVQSKPSISPNKPRLDYVETQADGLASKNLHALENPHASNGLLFKDEIYTTKQAIQNALKEPEVSQMVSTYTNCHATSHEKENFTRSQNSAALMDIRSQISPQIENDPQVTNKLAYSLPSWDSSASVEDLSPSRLSSRRTAVGWNETQDRQIIAMDSQAIDAKCNSKLDKNLCLPFLKKSPFWNTIESMEIFKIVPQKPHFRPLIEYKEEFREGSAIGFMVTFETLCKNISSLQFNDSRSVFESTLESLLDLEKHGFDVTVPRNRVNKLLLIKDGKDKLLNESKDVERQMREHNDEKRKLDEKITELQEKLAFDKSQMESKGNDFERIATASWELP